MKLRTSHKGLHGESVNVSENGELHTYEVDMLGLCDVPNQQHAARLLAMPGWILAPAKMQMQMPAKPPMSRTPSPKAEKAPEEPEKAPEAPKAPEPPAPTVSASSASEEPLGGFRRSKKKTTSKKPVIGGGD